MRLLRGTVISVGFGLLGLFGLVELVLRRHEAGSAALVDQDHDPDVISELSGTPAPLALSRVRTVVGVVGVALAGYGVYLVVRTVPWTSYLAIAIWLAAAVVLHDAVLVPAVSVLRGATLRVGRRLTAASVALIEGAFVVGGVLSLIAVPEIWAKHLGPLNPSVLPGSYGQALIVAWLILGVLTGGSVAILSMLARRRTGHRLGLVK